LHFTRKQFDIGFMGLIFSLFKEEPLGILFCRLIMTQSPTRRASPPKNSSGKHYLYKP